MIKGIRPTFLEIGKIKIGRVKGEPKKAASGAEWRQSEKLDHFIITKTSRGSDGNFIRDEDVMNALKKGAPGNGTKLDDNGNMVGIPVSVMYNNPDLVFPTRYARWEGKSCICSGDGVAAVEVRQNGTGSFSHSNVRCMCEFLTVPDTKGNFRCKPSGTLSVVIRGMNQVGGCHVFRTTSYNTIASVLGSLIYVRGQSKGLLAGLDLQMIIRPKIVYPNGKPQVAQIVSIVYSGNNNSLRDKALLEYQKDAGLMREQRLIESNIVEASHHVPSQSMQDGNDETESMQDGNDETEEQTTTAEKTTTVENPNNEEEMQHGPNMKHLMAYQKHAGSEEILKAIDYLNRDQEGNLTGNFPSEGWTEEQVGKIIDVIEKF